MAEIRVIFGEAIAEIVADCGCRGYNACGKEASMAPVASVKDNDIEAAAAMDNVDRAAKHLQDLAGIATGDVASHYLNEEKWAGADRTARVKLLQEWLKAEVLYEE